MSWVGGRGTGYPGSGPGQRRGPGWPRPRARG